MIASRTGPGRRLSYSARTASRLGLPMLIRATAAGLPPARFATGMALATTARQLGAVLGVALLGSDPGHPNNLTSSDLPS
jgi:hypothetical protein